MELRVAVVAITITIIIFPSFIFIVVLIFAIIEFIIISTYIITAIKRIIAFINFEMGQKRNLQFEFINALSCFSF